MAQPLPIPAEPPRVGDTLAALRQAQALSLDALSRKAGVSKSMLSQIERAQANPTVAVVWRLANALGVPLGELLGSAPPPVAAPAIPIAGRWTILHDPVAALWVLIRLRVTGACCSPPTPSFVSQRLSDRYPRGLSRGEKGHDHRGHESYRADHSEVQPGHDERRALSLFPDVAARKQNPRERKAQPESEDDSGKGDET